MSDHSLWALFWHAGLIVKCVLLILVAASIVSWTFIFQRWQVYTLAQQQLAHFEQQFWQHTNIENAYRIIKNAKNNPGGINNIFMAGFSEFKRLKNHSMPTNEIIDATQRAMRVVQNRELDQLERHLSFLATVGSTSPYVGLFGTVWGIITAFGALSHTGQATIAMVAPGISEALVATAIGLFAAIPAVIAYNRFSYQLEKLMNRYESFQDQLIGLLHRQLHTPLSNTNR